MSQKDVKKEIDAVSGTETTGHDWDGIRELDTPTPRWWLVIFCATIIWAAGYWVVYPAWPGITSYTHGIWDHSQRDEVTANVASLKAARAGREAALAKASLADIQKNPDLLQFAMAEGKTTFGDNCVPCHGAGGQGGHGYPNLNDDVWLWGGKLSDIEHTITVGVRSTAADTRQSQMPAFGRDAILKPAQVDDLVEYVVHISGRPADARADGGCLLNKAVAAKTAGNGGITLRRVTTHRAGLGRIWGRSWTGSGPRAATMQPRWPARGEPWRISQPAPVPPYR